MLEVNGIPGWQALQSVCREDLTARVVSACEALVRREAALVQGGGHQGAGGPGRLERAQVLVAAHAAAGIDRHARQRRRELGHGLERRPGAAADAGQIDHQQLAHARALAPAARPRPARGRRAPGSGEISRPSRRSTLSTSGGSAAPAGRGRPVALGASIDSVPTTLRAAPARASGRRPLGAWSRRRRPRARATAASAASVASSGGCPASASRSATYRRARAAYGAQRARHRHRLAPVDERAAQRSVVGALAAAGVYDDATLEIEDRNDSHRSAS